MSQWIFFRFRTIPPSAWRFSKRGCLQPDSARTSSSSMDRQVKRQHKPRFENSRFVLGKLRSHEFQANQTISNSFYQLTFDSVTGRLAKILNLKSGVSSNVCPMRRISLELTHIQVDQTFAWFNSSTGNTGPLFHPGQV